jgi:hypothetical protein
LRQFDFLSAFIFIPAIQYFNILSGNPKQIELNFSLSLDSGSLAGMTKRLLNLL